MMLEDFGQIKEYIIALINKMQAELEDAKMQVEKAESFTDLQEAYQRITTTIAEVTMKLGVLAIEIGKRQR